jgi:cell division protein FtsQ
MDGAGRSSRSRGSSGPKTDLKAAAIGAVVLLREYFGFDRKRVKAPREEPPPRAILWLERYSPRRAVLWLTLATLLGSATLGVVKGGHVDVVLAQLADGRNALANSAGFHITSITINGRRQLSQDEVLGIGGVNGRSSLLFLDAATVRDKLKANPWIAEATVLKFYPGQLQIDLVERTAFALWQQDGRPAPAISSRSWRAIRKFTPSPKPRSSSASGAGICV